ncbi:O-methyltransferase [Lachnospiraceae bacterium ZAX-1]
MIVDERMAAYLNSFDGGNTQLLNQIEAEAKTSFVPVIRKEMQSLLKLLLAIKRPAAILEVGTAVGFSSLFMEEYNPVECRIKTIENYEKRIIVAQENLKRAGKEHVIQLLKGDALLILEELETPFDFVFMDAAKAQYIHFLPHVLRLLKPNGILVSDNVMQEGIVIESRFAVTRRNRTIHKRMREYLYEITHHNELTTSILPIGDGAAISVRNSVCTKD